MAQAFSFKFPKKHARPVLLGLALLLLLSGSWLRAFDLYELQTYDWRCKTRGPRPTSPQIVFIDIWNDTLDQLGRFPFGREYHALLIDALRDAGAKAVIFDILFTEPHEQDDYVQTMAKKAQNVYFAYSFADPVMRNGVFTATKLDSNLLPAYAEAGKAAGYVNAKADMDGKRRRCVPLIFFEGKPRYHLAVRALIDLVGGRPEDVVFRSKDYLQLKSGIRIPLDDFNCMNVSFAGTWKDSFKHYSYVQVLVSSNQAEKGEKPEIDLSAFKDKICIIGLTAQGSHDTSPVPIEPVYPMVGIYANVMNNVLMNDYIRRADRWLNLFLLVAFGGLIIWISLHHKPIRALLLTLAALSVFVAAVVGTFFTAGLWLDLFYPTLVFLILYASITLLRALSEMRKRELIESELKIASQIQKSFLPAAMPEVKGMAIAAFFQPAKAVGGDLYAFIKLPSDNQFGVMGGDVSGKGAPAALFMAKTVSEFKFSARDRLDPGQALEQVNNAIASESTGGLFVTMAYAIFDVAEKKMLLANAGHLPLVAVAPDGSSELLTKAEGMPIGVMDGVPFDAVPREVKPGELFAFYSDGVSEARNKKKEEYDVQRLQAQLVKHRALPVNEILDRTVEDLKSFMGKADQHDDITLIVVKMEAPQ